MTTTTETTSTTKTEYLTTAQEAALIRAELKARGITTRQVSVRARNFSMGSAIDVTIKVSGISKSMVEKIAKKFESIRYDDYGEILSGCNQYVHVDFASEAHAAHAAAILAAFPAEPTDGRCVRLDCTDWLVCLNRDGSCSADLFADDDFRPIEAYSPECLARCIAEYADA
jgi:hypothetical protein